MSGRPPSTARRTMAFTTTVQISRRSTACRRSTLSTPAIDLRIFYSSPALGSSPATGAPRLRTPLSRANLVICESGPPVLLGPLLAEQAPQAARIYRVSDDIHLLNAPDILLRAEQNHRPFTRISTASPHIAARFTGHPDVTFDPIGIPHTAVRGSTTDPYPKPRPGPIAVRAGTTLLDIPALTRVADARPN